MARVSTLISLITTPQPYSCAGIAMGCATSATSRHIQVLKDSKAADKAKAKAAMRLGVLAERSVANCSAIAAEGALPPLVALLSGSDEAKCQAAYALCSLAADAEVAAAIAACGAREPLEALAKDQRKDQYLVDLMYGIFSAEQALELLPEVASHKDLEAVRVTLGAEKKPSAEPGTTAIPTGEGTRVAMFSARFDGGAMEEKFRKVHSILRDHKYDVLMVAADAGESFADLTTEYLGRLQREQGTMLAVCTKHYGEMTASAYSSHKELKFALDYESDVKDVPLKVEDTYPPDPPGGPEHKYDKKCLAKGYIVSVFKPGVVYLDCQDKSERDIAADIANHLLKRKVKG